MHMNVDTQRREHERRLTRLLDAPVTHHAASAALGYRTRLRLHVRSRGTAVSVGYFRARSKTILVPRICHVADPRLDRARLAIAEILHGPLDGELSLALGAGELPVGELVLSAGEPSGALIGSLDALVRSGVLAGFRLLYPHGAPIGFGAPAPVTDGADGAPVTLAPGGFAQSSAAINRELAVRAMAAVDSLGLRPDARVFEMHAGAGNFTVLLAARTSRLETFELSAPAVLAARANLAARGLVAKVHEAAAERVTLPNRLPLLVLDPPREGARELVQNARNARVQALVYVSCDPPSLARDRAILGDDYALTRLELFEMFPQTSHVETLATFTRRPA
jgi:23S rRNA (uracil1939-C5)-methyltransferase